MLHQSGEDQFGLSGRNGGARKPEQADARPRRRGIQRRLQLGFQIIQPAAARSVGEKQRGDGRLGSGLRGACERLPQGGLQPVIRRRNFRGGDFERTVRRAPDGLACLSQNVRVFQVNDIQV